MNGLNEIIANNFEREAQERRLKEQEKYECPPYCEACKADEEEQNPGLPVLLGRWLARKLGLAD